MSSDPITLTSSDHLAGSGYLESDLAQGFVAPDRQPRSPPPNIDIQEFEGFARFLKTHTSPRSKRVTAGGRVVSAGPNSPPPTFHTEFIDRLLVDCEQKKEKASAPQQHNHMQTQKPLGFVANSTLSTSVPARPRASTTDAQPSEPKHLLGVPSSWKVVEVHDGGKTAIIVTGDTVLRGHLGPQGQTTFKILQASPVRPLQIEEKLRVC